MKKVDLFNVLSDAKPFLMKQDFIPIFSNFALIDNQVITYNDKQGVAIQFDHGQNIIIPGDLTLKVLNTLTHDEVELVKGKGEKLTIKSGKSKIQIPFQDGSEYLFSMPEPDSKPIILNKEFINGIKTCSISISFDPTYPEFNGVTIEGKAGTMNLYSTDNRTLSKYICKYQHEGDEELFFILPEEFCDSLIKLYNDYCLNNDEFELYLLQDKESEIPTAALVKLSDVCTVITKLCSYSKRRDYEAIVVKTTESADILEGMEIVPGDLIPALERSALMKERGQDEVFTEMDIAGKKISMNTETSVGKVNDTIDIKNEYGDFNYSVDPNLILRGLKVTSSMYLLPRVTVLVGSDNAFIHLISHRDN